MNYRELIAKRVAEAWNAESAERHGDLYADDVRYFDRAVPGGISGKENVVKYLAQLYEQCPGMRFEALSVDELEESDEVVLKWRGHIPDGLAGSANTVEVEGVTHYVFERGKIVRTECFYDQLLLAGDILVASRAKALNA